MILCFLSPIQTTFEKGRVNLNLHKHFTESIWRQILNSNIKFIITSLASWISLSSQNVPPGSLKAPQKSYILAFFQCFLLVESQSREHTAIEVAWYFTNVVSYVADYVQRHQSLCVLSFWWLPFLHLLAPPEQRRREYREQKERTHSHWWRWT